MKEWEESRMIEYVQLLNELKDRVSNEQTAAMIVAEIAKDRRMAEMGREKRTATDKQLRFLDKLGIEHPEGISKQEASRLIDEELAKNGEK